MDWCFIRTNITMYNSSLKWKMNYILAYLFFPSPFFFSCTLRQADIFRQNDSGRGNSNRKQQHHHLAHAVLYWRALNIISMSPFKLLFPPLRHTKPLNRTVLAKFVTRQKKSMFMFGFWHKSLSQADLGYNINQPYLTSTYTDRE